jgi:hypothetical protein
MALGRPMGRFTESGDGDSITEIQAVGQPNPNINQLKQNLFRLIPHANLRAGSPYFFHHERHICQRIGRYRTRPSLALQYAGGQHA